MASCATSIVDQLSIEQKVAQMIQGETRGLNAEDVKKYGLGSVLNGGGAFPGGDKYATPQDWVDLADAYYSASIDASGGCNRRQRDQPNPEEWHTYPLPEMLRHRSEHCPNHTFLRLPR